MKSIKNLAFLGVLIWLICIWMLLNINIQHKPNKPTPQPVEVQIEQPMMYTWDDGNC